MQQDTGNESDRGDEADDMGCMSVAGGKDVLVIVWNRSHVVINAMIS